MSLKSINSYKSYAIILDKNTGNYYGTKLNNIVLIDNYDNCLVEIENGKRLVIPMRDIYDKCYDMYTVLSIANQN